MANSKIKDRVKNKSKMSANVVSLLNIKSVDLIDYPHNNEDLRHTIDLETSMKEEGFTTPIEVTDFGMETGKYMILAGHRRRVAGDKVGTFSAYPCLLKKMKSEEQVRNYVLMANSHRDSGKNPMLLPNRYKMHYDYLESIGTDKGKIRAIICDRMGISKAQGDRFYNLMMKVISTVHDMINEGKTGISNVQMMASHTIDEQNEIVEILEDALKHGEVLSRPFVEKMVKAYRDGKKTYVDIIQVDITEVIEMPKQEENETDNINYGTAPSSPAEPKEDKPRNRNDEVRREYDPESPLNEKDPYANERLTEEDYQTIEAVANAGKKDDVSEEEKALKIGKDIHKLISKLGTSFENVYSFEGKEEARNFMGNMGLLFSNAIDEMYQVSEKHDLKDDFKKVVKALNDTLGRNYK